jgi:hypothetical protein
MKKECSKCKKSLSYGIVNTYSNSSVYAINKQLKPWNGSICPRCNREKKIAEKKLVVLENIKCHTCQSEFTPRNRQAKYCSSRCRVVMTMRRKIKPTKPKNDCVVCLTPNSATRLYCGSQCQSKAAYLRNKVERVCIECGNSPAKSKYCSATCRSKANRRPAKPRSHKVKKCVTCGSEFRPRGKQLYCDNPCRRPKPSINRESLRKYKKIARKKRKLWERRACPRWVKGSDLLKIEASKPGPEYHLDHIIPLKHPLVCGLHVPENLQWLKKEENEFKNNKWDGTETNESWKVEFEKSRSKS